MYLTEDEKRLTGKFKNRIEALLGADRIRMFLFGSKARGDAYRHSDIDIAIIIKNLTRVQKNLILEEVAGFEFENNPAYTFTKEDFIDLKREAESLAHKIQGHLKIKGYMK